MAAATVDARVLRDAMSRYLEALRAHRDELDSLNVFPVPDGDTGTNMLLTQEAVQRALDREPGGDLAGTGETISRAALMGARGNSGVILSQTLRGLCGRLAREESAAASAVAEALAEAAGEARKSVAEPAEGTMLSVLNDAAEGATGALSGGANLREVLEAARDAASASLERTTDQLPALAEAGVVDAGAKGVVVLLDALVAASLDQPLSIAVGPLGPVGRGAARGDDAREGYGFEVMYLIECEDAAVVTLRSRLGGLGDSLVVVGGGGLYNVHVHTDEPDGAVAVADTVGRTREVRITSLDEQIAATCVAGEARAVRAGGPAAGAQATAMVAIAPATGVARLFRALGSRVVVSEPGEPPPTSGLVAAIRGAPAGAVVVLPNDPGAITSARAPTGGKKVRVVPTRSIPQGLAAAAGFLPDRPLEENARAMEEAARRVASAEVTVADGDTPVRAAEFLGIVDGEVRARGADAAEVAAAVAGLIHREGHEVLTLLWGAGISEADAHRAASLMAEALPSVEVEVHEGGQPRHPFLIGLE